MLKERKIIDLERRLKAKEDEIDRLKAERDKLAAISNDLRAQVNMAERRILEHAEEALGQEDREQNQEAIEEQHERIRKIDRYVDDLALQMRDWIDNEIAQNHNNAVKSERKIGGGGRVSSKK